MAYYFLVDTSVGIVGGGTIDSFEEYMYYEPTAYEKNIGNRTGIVH